MQTAQQIQTEIAKLSAKQREVLRNLFPYGLCALVVRKYSDMVVVEPRASVGAMGYFVLGPRGKVIEQRVW